LCGPHFEISSKEILLKSEATINRFMFQMEMDGSNSGKISELHIFDVSSNA
jgi:hypothetical protein